MTAENNEIVITDIPQGKFFVVLEHPTRPKLMLKEGYFDLTFGVRNLPNGYNPKWPVEPITEEKAMKLLQGLNISEDGIKSRMERAKNLVDKDRSFEVSPE